MHNNSKIMEDVNQIKDGVKAKLCHVTSLDEVFTEKRNFPFDKRGLSTKVQMIGKNNQTVAEVDFDCLAQNLLSDVTKEVRSHPDVAEIDFSEFRAPDSGLFCSIPRTLGDLDDCGKNVLMYGAELDADHPGFKDAEYRKRRDIFTKIALSYNHGDAIPRIEYTKEEIETWGKAYKELMSLYPTHACQSYIKNLPLLSENCGYGEHQIPQLEDVSKFLQRKTGFRLRPVAGFLSPRDFLAGLAFRVFNCTQYIRHSSDPFYTPEPDVCHELLGHVPLLADPDFADFNQDIGLASLGASDEEISKLAACYLYTVEFGICKEEGKPKAFGAGLLSSIAELKHALSSTSKHREFDPEQASKQEFYVTTYQPVYFVSPTIRHATQKLREFVKTIPRTFSVRFDASTSTLSVSHKSDSKATSCGNVKQSPGS